MPSDLKGMTPRRRISLRRLFREFELRHLGTSAIATLAGLGVALAGFAGSDHRSIFEARRRPARGRARRSRKPRHRARARVVRVRLRHGDRADQEDTARCEGGESKDHAADDQRWCCVRRGRRWPSCHTLDPLLADGMGQGHRCLEDPCRAPQRVGTRDRLCPGSRNRDAVSSERHPLDSLSPHVRHDRANVVDRGVDRRPWTLSGRRSSSGR